MTRKTLEQATFKQEQLLSLVWASLGSLLESQNTRAWRGLGAGAPISPFHRCRQLLSGEGTCPTKGTQLLKAVAKTAHCPVPAPIASSVAQGIEPLIFYLGFSCLESRFPASHLDVAL